jgi:hypothetical protein
MTPSFVNFTNCEILRKGRANALLEAAEKLAARAPPQVISRGCLWAAPPLASYSFHIR